MSDPIKEFTKKWESRSIRLTGNELWEFGKETREEMEKFRQQSDQIVIANSSNWRKTLIS